jgi:hypothetical protein
MAAVNRKVISKFSGYDIFISYRHKEAQLYAMQLHAVLESKGLLVFRDESEEDNLGTNIKQFEGLPARRDVYLLLSAIHVISDRLHF